MLQTPRFMKKKTRVGRQMFLTLHGGLLIVTDDATNPTYDATFMGIAMVAINSFGFVALVFSLIALHPKCRKRLNGKKKSPKEMVGDKTKVSPMITDDTINNRIKQSAELRKIRLEYGAGSKEYLDAVNDIQE